ncbi:MAG TPA: hypothetical protein VN859_04945 [Steroidobacteraceae bacterium]|nr:hypothetical protein [Steroidobacteraceae bacterium]
MIDAPRRAQFGRRALQHAEALCAGSCDTPVRAELEQQQESWTEFRLLVVHHLHILQWVTRFTIVLDSDSSPRALGWLVEKRKLTSGVKRLSDAALIERARSLPQIGAQRPLIRMSVDALDAQHSFSILRFGAGAPADLLDVSINHTSGEIIGVLPASIPGATALVLSGDGLEPRLAAAAEAAEQHAWGILESSLTGQLDPGGAEQLRSIFAITLDGMVRDNAGRLTASLQLWRSYSEADVTIDSGSGEIVNWYVEAFQADAPERRIDETEAIERARVHLRAEQGVCGPSVAFGDIAGAQKATVHWWHAEGECNVEGDYVTVLLNATTGQVFSVAHKWRPVEPGLLAPPAITASQAVRAADLVHGSDPPGQSIGRSIIETGGSAEQPDAVQNRAVWRVGYTELGGIGLTELAIDCATGELARQTGW